LKTLFVFLEKTAKGGRIFRNLQKNIFTSRQIVLSFVRFYGVVSKFDFFALNLVGWNKTFRGFRPGEKLALASMRKLFDPQSW
jgi:hypothetical protein